MSFLPALLFALACAGGSRAHVEASVETAHIGEPFELTLVVEHPTGATLTLPEPSALPRSFALVEDRGLVRTVDPSTPAQTTTRARWRVIALEGGDALLPPLHVTIDAAGAQETIDAAAPKLAIEHALDANEDAPRPALGFRPPPVVHVVSLRGVAIGLASVLVLLVAGLVVWRIRRARVIAVPVPTPLERLAEIERRLASEPELVRDATYELTGLLRRAVDEHRAESHAGLTDGDWIKALASDERVPSATRTLAAKLLDASERVKYAAESPSILTVRESLGDTRLALTALAEPEKAAA